MVPMILNGVIYTGVNLIIKQETTTVGEDTFYFIAIYNMDQLVHRHDFEDDESSCTSAISSIKDMLGVNSGFIDFDSIFEPHAT